MKKNKSAGKLHVITGPMFAGKSEELIKRLRRYKISGAHVMIFNHALDVRYAKNEIASHSKQSWRATSITKARDIVKKIKKNTNVVVIDEAQFFDGDLIGVVNQLITTGKTVIAAGLDTNFRGESFGSMPELLALADGDVVKLKSVCAVCRKWNATRTQRILSDGSPAPYNDSLVKIGTTDSYQARCREHHEVPK